MANRAGRILWVSVLLSAALHGLVLRYWPAPAAPQSMAEGPILVSLQRAAPATAVIIDHSSPPVPMPATKKPPANSTAASEHRVPQAARAAKVTPRASDPATAPVPSPSVPGDQPGPAGPAPVEPAQMAQIAASVPPAPTLSSVAAQPGAGKPSVAPQPELGAMLHREILAHRHYPYLAKRQRREGVASIGFMLHPDGSITDLVLQQSSGYRLLDQAARRSVEAINPSIRLGQLLRQPREFQVDIEFRLRG